MRREVVQLQRWDRRGSEEVGTRKSCVAAPQRQDTVKVFVFDIAEVCEWVEME